MSEYFFLGGGELGRLMVRFPQAKFEIPRFSVGSETLKMSVAEYQMRFSLTCIFYNLLLLSL